MKTKTGITRIVDGIEQTIIVESYHASYPYDHIVKKVIGEPTKNGRESARYRKVKHDLGDDWTSDITNCWFELGELPLSDQLKIVKALEEVI